MIIELFQKTTGEIFMGRGDKKTRKGKIFAGSFGKTRPRKKVKNTENKENTQEKSE